LHEDPLAGQEGPGAAQIAAQILDEDVVLLLTELADVESDAEPGRFRTG
jgi:hypothetical protein